MTHIEADDVKVVFYQAEMPYYIVDRHADAAERQLSYLSTGKNHVLRGAGSYAVYLSTAEEGVTADGDQQPQRGAFQKKQKLAFRLRDCGNLEASHIFAYNIWGDVQNLIQIDSDYSGEVTVVPFRAVTARSQFYTHEKRRRAN
jgi:hypothetical protein